MNQISDEGLKNYIFKSDNRRPKRLDRAVYQAVAQSPHILDRLLSKEIITLLKFCLNHRFIYEISFVLQHQNAVHRIPPAFLRQTVVQVLDSMGPHSIDATTHSSVLQMMASPSLFKRMSGKFWKGLFTRSFYTNHDWVPVLLLKSGPLLSYVDQNPFWILDALYKSQKKVSENLDKALVECDYIDGDAWFRLFNQLLHESEFDRMSTFCERIEICQKLNQAQQNELSSLILQRPFLLVNKPNLYGMSLQHVAQTTSQHIMSKIKPPPQLPATILKTQDRVKQKIEAKHVSTNPHAGKAYLKSLYKPDNFLRRLPVTPRI